MSDIKLCAAVARAPHAFCLAFSQLDGEDMASTLLSYDGSKSQPWDGRWVPRNIRVLVDDTTGNAPVYVAIADESDLYALLEDDTAYDKIPGAGLDSEDATKNLGYIMDAAVVGNRLYASGQEQQLYMRDGARTWTKIEDEGFPPGQGYRESPFESIAVTQTSGIAIFADDDPSFPESPEIDLINKQRREARDRGDKEEASRLFDKAYALEASIRKPNRGRILHFDGQAWENLDVDDLRPGVVRMEADGTIWGGASGGHFFWGNAEDGLETAKVIEGENLFYTAAKLGDRYILGGSAGLVSVQPLPDTMEVDVRELKPTIPLGHYLSVLKVQTVPDGAGGEALMVFDYNYAVHVMSADGDWTTLDVPIELTRFEPPE